MLKQRLFPATGLLRRNRSYRNLWLAQTGSGVGDWFNQVALAQATLELTGSPSAMGFVLLCRALPSVVLGPLISPLVDRFPKRRMLYLTDFVRAVLACSFAFALFFKAHWILYVGSVLMGLASLFFAPARNAALPYVVDKGDLAEANALESGTYGVNSIVGTVLGGVVATTMSPVVCFAINALSFLWSALCIRQAQWQEKSIGQAERVSYLHSLQDGFREAARNKAVRAIVLIGISWGIAGGGYYVLIPVLGHSVYHMGGLGIGLLYAVDGLGVLIGAVLVKRFVGRGHLRAVRWYGVAYLTQALFFAAMAQFTSFGLGACLLLLMRISSGVIIPLDNYLLQTSTQPELLGRVSALHASTYGGVMQISYAVVGILFEQWGIPLMGWLIGLVSFACGLSWLWQMKQKPTSETNLPA